MADMGGVSYFHLACNAPNGNFDDLDAAMNAANKLVDETAEDRKGGAGDYAKIFFSAGDDNLIAVAHVPDALKANIDIKEWIMACMSTVGGAVVGDVYDNKLKAEAKADRDNNLFPLKMRDTAIGAGFEFLRKKGLVNDHDSDDDVDYRYACSQPLPPFFRAFTHSLPLSLAAPLPTPPESRFVVCCCRRTLALTVCCSSLRSSGELGTFLRRLKTLARPHTNNTCLFSC
jgi:hypothetical protein